MFSDFHIEADRRMADYERDAVAAAAAAEARPPAAPIDEERRRVRFPVPGWLKHAPFAVHSSTR
jgi:hypothetical protein